MGDGSRPRWLLALGAVFLVGMAILFASSLRRPSLVSFEPVPPVPRAAPAGLVTDTVTLDARDGARWVLFDFERGTTLPASDPAWDVGVRRFHLVVNGGERFTGSAGAVALPAAWADVSEAPEAGYATTAGELDGEPTNPALERWYRYSFFAHTLDPKPRTYVVRTAEGRYAKLRILSYYCPEATPGCLTIEYAFQGDGSRRLAP